MCYPYYWHSKIRPYGEGIAEGWTLKPTIEDQTEKYNRIINDDTIRWWGQQSPEALDEAMSDDDRLPLKDCMEILYKLGWNRRAVWIMEPHLTLLQLRLLCVAH